LRWQEPNARGVADDWEKTSSRVLVRDLDEFTLSYRSNFAAGWTSEFDRNVTPELVRMQIKASGRYWPDLILKVERTR
jgi:general secretion pathway protein J